MQRIIRALSVVSILWSSQLVQAECVHTYREPRCVGGKECMRREIIPCDTPEPSLQRKLYEGVREGTEGMREEFRDLFGPEDREPTRSAPTGVRG